jgi:hypothetical protein
MVGGKYEIGRDDGEGKPFKGFMEKRFLEGEGKKSEQDEKGYCFAEK